MNLRSFALPVVIAAIMLPPSGFAQAQTTANGPYYATPSWDQTMPASTRFIVLANMNGQAVLDRESGLVWEKSPNNSNRFQEDAAKVCIDSTLGGHGGWRLPSVHELTSLIDGANKAPSLPTGHPFIGVNFSETFYWSATTYGSDSQSAWIVEFYDYIPQGASIFVGRTMIVPKTQLHLVWCVRGGGPVATY